MREDTPTKKALRLKDSLRKRESRAREHSLTRLSRQSQDAASTKELRAREDSPTRLARQTYLSLAGIACLSQYIQHVQQSRT